MSTTTTAPQSRITADRARVTDTPEVPTPEATDTTDLGDCGNEGAGRPNEPASRPASRVRRQRGAGEGQGLRGRPKKSDIERLAEQLEQLKAEAATAKAETLR